jgi:hypothetical protein
MGRHILGPTMPATLVPFIIVYHVPPEAVEIVRIRRTVMAVAPRAKWDQWISKAPRQGPPCGHVRPPHVFELAG